MTFPPILLRIAGLPASMLLALNRLSEDNSLLAEEEWTKLYYQTVADLCQSADNPSLLNGLQMTSHSLAGRVQKIIDQLPPTLRKKEQQTARSLWQIASRMAGKTSPFSSFTHLGQVDKKEVNPRSIHYRFRLNNILLGQLLELLRYHSAYFQNQKISLNYSIQLIEEEYVFLHNTRNIESVQRIEKQPVIDLIASFLKDKNPILFKELLAYILSEVAADQDEIVDYVFSLAEYGFLVWELPIAPVAENWWRPLSKQLKEISTDPLAQKLEKILSNIETVLETLSAKKPIERAAIQQKYFKLFKDIWEENKHRIPSTNSDLVMEEGLKRITDLDFLLKPETIFYEDTRLRVREFWTEINWRPLREKMRFLSQGLISLTPSGSHEQLVNFYQENFNEPISLWAFYQQWLPVAKHLQVLEKSNISKIKLKLNNRLATLPKSESIIHLSPHFLRSLSPDQIAPSYFGTLVLPFHADGVDQIFLDTFVSADARLAARFLPLFPEETTQAWRNFHQAQAANNLWIENQDSSFFNANVHPPLLSANLKIPSLSIAGSNQDIPITKLMVTLDKEKKHLVLKHQNQIVKVLNLSLEATDNRSGLYQLLCRFEEVVPSKHLLLNSINERIPLTKQGIIKYPRVVYDQQIVLQRTTWFFPKQTLPFKPKGSTAITYQNQLLQWLKENDLPKQFYYTLNFDHRATGKNNRRNEHKPQFFDIRNPLSIDLWYRDLKKVTHYLKIEEMLPLPENLIAVDGVKRMVEALVMV